MSLTLTGGRLSSSLLTKLCRYYSSGASSGTFALHKHLHGEGVFTLRIENEAKKNAVTFDSMYQAGDHIRAAAADKECKSLFWIGAGDIFCSGLDLFDFAAKSHCLDNTVDQAIRAKSTREAGKKVTHFVTSLIDFPKPLIAAVNGPAIGIGVTALALCDSVVASADRAYFTAPFSSLGFVVEACSSYTFPMLLGPQLANDILLFGRMLKAKEAYDSGLVNRIVSGDLKTFETAAAKIAQEASRFPPNFYQAAKKLLRRDHRDNLMKTCQEEIDSIAIRWQSQEVADAVSAFMNRKKK